MIPAPENLFNYLIDTTTSFWFLAKTQISPAIQSSTLFPRRENFQVLLALKSRTMRDWQTCKQKGLLCNPTAGAKLIANFQENGLKLTLNSETFSLLSGDLWHDLNNTWLLSTLLYNEFVRLRKVFFFFVHLNGGEKKIFLRANNRIGLACKILRLNYDCREIIIHFGNLKQ